MELNLRMPPMTWQAYISEVRVQPGYQGETSASYSGSVGSDALGNPITIRIYNRSGVYLETVYYPNMGFISRHEVNDEFAAFLRGCMAK